MFVVCCRLFLLYVVICYVFFDGAVGGQECKKDQAPVTTINKDSQQTSRNHTRNTENIGVFSMFFLFFVVCCWWFLLFVVYFLFFFVS